jgi:AraC-like DNA-binding protein
MERATHFQLQIGWKLLMADMGISVADTLTLAGLPADLFSRNDACLTAQEYFDIIMALESLVPPDTLPLLLGQAISVESFDPPIFASLCAPNMLSALQRLKIHKRLIGPMIMEINEVADGVAVSMECYGYDKPLPKTFSTAEVVFLTKLSRIGTRFDITPVRVTLTELPQNLEPYSALLGSNLSQGERTEVVFSNEDLHRPFLTENFAMWQYFEPSLKQRLGDLDSEASIGHRVKSVLLELLPSGESSIEMTAKRLAMSKRTLQRKLNQSSENFQDILKHTRQELAKHYLKDAKLSTGEISFLLGFQDTNSFIRAHSSWTGRTPGDVRKTM